MLMDESMAKVDPTGTVQRVRKVLVIDDQLGVPGSTHQRAFSRAFGGVGFEYVFEACVEDNKFDPHKPLAVLRHSSDFDLVLLDLRFGDGDDRSGFEILRELT